MGTKKSANKHVVCIWDLQEPSNMSSNISCFRAFTWHHWLKCGTKHPRFARKTSPELKEQKCLERSQQAGTCRPNYVDVFSEHTVHQLPGTDQARGTLGPGPLCRFSTLGQRELRHGRPGRWPNTPRHGQRGGRRSLGMGASKAIDQVQCYGPTSADVQWRINKSNMS